VIKNIIAMLQLDDFYGESQNIQIAKGLYSMPTEMKEIWKLEKRRRTIKLQNRDGRNKNN
jgi:hypothetical protein